MTEFFKVSGSGNDFLALVETREAPEPETIRAWCRRGVSLGADGLFILRQGPGEVVMDYFNADGYPADLCLNGTRCAAQLAFHLGWAEENLTIRTGAGTVAARREDETRVTLELPAPEMPRELEIQAGGIRCAGYRLRVGVPHFVLPWPESLDRAPVESLGKEIRHHPAFEEGTNVNFVRFPGKHRMEIRTFERGVETETLSCGSGILAGAAVGVHLGRSALPLRVAVQGGFELEVGAVPGGAAWLLTGDARVIARGTLLGAAAASPPPPSWS
ncbi:MAG TPA: diaminopimelate epimerase [Thermoanaerobaculia bacterium]|nr:diaminopimelate epimerase [Thermoanaerobaculia bacterium]